MQTGLIFSEFFHKQESHEIFVRSVSCPHKNVVDMVGVLLHPFPFTSEIYSSFYLSENLKHLILTECSERRHIEFLFPDLPGFGKSHTGKDSKNLSQYCDIVRALIGERKAIVGGCSMGGYIALECLRFLNNVEGLILIDTQHYADSEQKSQSRINQAQQFLKILQGVPNSQQATLGILGVKFPQIVEFEMNLVRALLYKKNYERLKEKAKFIMDQSTLLGVIHALYAMAGRNDTSSLLRSFEKLTYIIVGEHDTITSPSLAEQMATLAPNSILDVIPDSGHLPMIENSKVFNSSLTKAIKLILEN